MGRTRPKAGSKSVTGETHPGPRKLGDVLVDLMARRGYAQVSASEALQQAWQSLVGELAQLTYPVGVKRGVLQVLVSSSVIMQELTFRKQELTQGMQTMHPEHRVKEIRFRLSDLP